MVSAAQVHCPLFCPESWKQTGSYPPRRSSVVPRLLPAVALCLPLPRWRGSREKGGDLLWRLLFDDLVGAQQKRLWDRQP